MKKDLFIEKWYSTVNESHFLSEEMTLPVCKIMFDTLISCFHSDKCFSQQEYDLIRDVFASLYRVAMETAIKISDRLGEKILLEMVLTESPFNIKNNATNKNYAISKLESSGIDVKQNILRLIFDDYKVG